MDTSTIYTENRRGYTIEIFRDDDPANPRKDFDNAAHLVCWHRRYDLGDKHSYDDPVEFFESLAGEIDPDKVNRWRDNEKMTREEFQNKCAALVAKETVMLDLYLYDHSGITISVSLRYPFTDPWDAGQVGFAYMTRADVVREFGKWNKATKDKARRLILGEVETYDDYLTGNVYGYVVTDADGEDIDSCWGFFGDYDDPKNWGALQEARAQADYHANKRDKARELEGMYTGAGG